MNPNLFDIRKIMITLLMLALLWLVCSCGTRKVQKSDTKEDTKTEQATTEKKDIETKTETKTVINDETNDFEITPIDTSKVLIINGKIFKNAKVKIVNRKVNTTVAEMSTVKDLSKKTNTIKTDIVKTNKVKKVERKSNPFLTLLWLLIPVIGYLILKYKYKLIGL